MTRFGHATAAALATLCLGRGATAQQFLTNCTWKTARMVGSLLGMYCHNDNWAEFSYDWSW